MAGASVSPAVAVAARFLDAGLPDQALAHIRRAIDETPGQPALWRLLALVLLETGAADDALQAADRALALDRDDGEAHTARGTALQRLGRHREALEAFAEAARLAPELALAHYNLGIELRRGRRLEDARAAFAEATRLAPDLAAAWLNLGSVHDRQGRAADALGAFDRARTLDPTLLLAWTNRLHSLNYAEAVTPETLKGEAEAFGAHLAALGLRAKAHGGRDGGGSLKVGYLGGDFHRHPVGRFLAPVLAAHDPDKYAVHVYACGAQADDLTARMKGDAAVWRDVAGLSDAEVAEAIEADGIDVLIEVSGYTAEGRPGVLARRPAPVQIAWIGAVATTGLAAVDAFIGDETGIPAGEERLYTETVVRLPHGWLCLEPPADAPAPAPPPMTAKSHPTFGSFNNLAKLSDACLELWRRVLEAVPDARLSVRNTAFADPGTLAATHARMAGLGLPMERVDLAGPLAPDALLGAYGAIDVALDTRPYSGGMTSCEALWMGVPVVTLPGATFASRHTASHLRHAGRSEWIAENEADFAAKAAALVADPGELADIRQGLRGQLAASPLCDTRGFTRELESVYDRLWGDWRTQNR